MMQIVLIALGAGAASALLFASIVSGSPLSFALANFAQLPIMLAAVGWTHVAGLLAALIASVGLAAATTGSVAIAFLLGIGLPAWWIGYLALLARPAPETSINMRRKRVRRLLQSPLRDRAHQIQPSAWPIIFIPGDDVSRARLETQPAMNAGQQFVFVTSREFFQCSQACR